MLVYDRLFIPLKILYACHTSFCRVEGKTSHRKHSEEEHACLLPSTSVYKVSCRKP